MNTKDPPYQSFLLRVWQTGSHAEPGWRFSLENPHSGERVGFIEFDSLVHYLATQLNTGAASTAGSAHPTGEKK